MTSVCMKVRQLEERTGSMRSSLAGVAGTVAALGQQGDKVQVSCDWWRPGHVTSIPSLIGPGRAEQAQVAHAAVCGRLGGSAVQHG